jgi:hypothetical protein
LDSGGTILVMMVTCSRRQDRWKRHQRFGLSSRHNSFNSSCTGDSWFAIAVQMKPESEFIIGIYPVFRYCTIHMSGAYSYYTLSGIALLIFTHSLVTGANNFTTASVRPLQYSLKVLKTARSGDSCLLVHGVVKDMGSQGAKKRTRSCGDVVEMDSLSTSTT